jgi:two-component system response regulator QseB
MRILVVEDDVKVAEFVRRGLAEEGYAVDVLHDGTDAGDQAAAFDYDAVVLDMMLPRQSGFQVLRSIRSRKASLPVVILTARDSVQDRIAGLDAGADDYLVKPYDLDELSARIRAVVRRKTGRAESTIRVGGLEIDTAAKRVTWRGRPVELSAREYALLEALALRPGAHLTRGQLEERLYGWDEEIASNAVEVHVHALRRKLDPALIRTVRGLGYTLAKP